MPHSGLPHRPAMDRSPSCPRYRQYVTVTNCPTPSALPVSPVTCIRVTLLAAAIVRHVTTPRSRETAVDAAATACGEARYADLADSPATVRGQFQSSRPAPRIGCAHVPGLWDAIG